MSIKELIKKVIGYSNVKMDSNYYRELGAVIGDNAVSYTHLTLPTNREV